MPPEPSPPPTRRWFRFHWVTWLFVIVEIAAFGYCQCFSEDWNYGMVTFRFFGWPTICVRQIHTFKQFGPTEFEYQCVYFPLFVNSLFLLLLVMSTAFVIESRMRCERRSQFTLLGLLKLTTVVAVVLTLVVRRVEIYKTIWAVGLRPSRLLENDLDLLNDQQPAYLAWPVTAIILFGLVCVIYATGSLAYYMASRLWKVAHRRV